jgi:hypothetical protein
MNRLHYIFLFSIIFSTTSFAQQPQSLLEWNEYYTLGWEDFQGRPAEGTFGDAGTAVHIKAKPYYVGKEIRYDVYAYFNREKSWKRDTSNALLKHEQLHFHIAELYARKIRKKIDVLSAAGTNDIDTYNAAIKQLLLESNEADERYDYETLHGAISKKQAAWEKKVLEELSQLDDYKKKKRVLGVRRLKKHPHIFAGKKQQKTIIARR